MEKQKSIWVDSLWTTRKETVSIEVDGREVTREISVGMTVKTDNRTASAEMYKALDHSLSVLIELEKDRWLAEELMRREQGQFTDMVEGMDELVQGRYRVVHDAAKTGS